jgi:phosphoglycerate dehydrogenase-like enzyme
LSARDVSGQAGTEGIYQAPRGVVISHPFVNVAWVDKKRLQECGVTLLFAPGCNRDAVAEWALGCTLTLYRELRLSINKRTREPKVTRARSLAGKRVAILGKGAVGTRVGEVLSALNMDVHYLERGGNIAEAVRGADLIMNCLSSKAENNKILNSKFFLSDMPKGSAFVSMTNPAIYEVDALLEALEKKHIRGAAIDIGGTFPGDTEQEHYKKFTTFLDRHPEFEDTLLVTPQVAHFSDLSQRISFDMAIDNIRHAAGDALDQIAHRVWR